MSVTTSQRLNADQLQAHLPGGAIFAVADLRDLQLPTTQPKTIAVVGASDAQLQAAIAAAAAAFVDYTANRATLVTRANNALEANTTYLSLPSPTQTQAVAQVAALTRQVDGLIRFALNRFDNISNS